MEGHVIAWTVWIKWKGICMLYIASSGDLSVSLLYYRNRRHSQQDSSLPSQVSSPAQTWLFCSRPKVHLAQGLVSMGAQ